MAASRRCAAGGTADALGRAGAFEHGSGLFRRALEHDAVRHLRFGEIALPGAVPDQRVT